MVVLGGDAMMRFLRYFVYCLVLFLLFGANSACSSPKALVEESIFQAGDVAQGKKITHDFTLKNIGDEVLTIDIKRC